MSKLEIEGSLCPCCGFPACGHAHSDEVVAQAILKAARIQNVAADYVRENYQKRQDQIHEVKMLMGRFGVTVEDLK